VQYGVQYVVGQSVLVHVGSGVSGAIQAAKSIFVTKFTISFTSLFLFPALVNPSCEHGLLT